MEPRGIIVLPEAGRDEQLERWSVSPERVGQRDRERGQHWHDYLDGVGTEPDGEDELGLEALGFLSDGGWHAVEPSKGTVRGEGTTSHRGVLHPDEYVDAVALRAAVEAELGFTYDDIHSVYRKGRISEAQVALRARIDSRLLDIALAGGELMPLARALGWAVQDAHSGGGATCRTLWRALARARKENA